jgi:predicted nucleic acid-binding protein
MIDAVLLDSGPLGLIAHSRPKRHVLEWTTLWLDSDAELMIPEIADYEVRRELLRAGLTTSLAKLDRLKAHLRFVPIKSEAMLKAAEFWAKARSVGKPSADSKSLDADMILAGQAATLDAQSVIIASTNPKHFTPFVLADRWELLLPP